MDGDVGRRGRVQEPSRDGRIKLGKETSTSSASDEMNFTVALGRVNMLLNG